MEEIKIIEWLSGIGYGSGNGNGSGNGSGSGDGYGSGYGNGDGSGYGDGDGSGDEVQLKLYENNRVFYIDKVPTIILQIHGNYAKGYTINTDNYQKSECFVAKDNATGKFAHGATLHEAAEALRDKIFNDMSEEDRINAFCKEFEHDKKYKGQVFFDWHHRLTGSCLFGRNQFVKEQGLSLDDEFTVDEFIDICINSYGGETIRQLKEKWEN